MALTDTRIRNEKPGEKPRKLADSGGLYLLLNQSGKYWRWSPGKSPASPVASTVHTPGPRA